MTADLFFCSASAYCLLLFEVYTRRLGFNEHRVGSERHTRANTFRRPTAQGSLFG